MLNANLQPVTMVGVKLQCSTVSKINNVLKMAYDENEVSLLYVLLHLYIKCFQKLTERELSMILADGKNL